LPTIAKNNKSRIGCSWDRQDGMRRVGVEAIKRHGRARPNKIVEFAFDLKMILSAAMLMAPIQVPVGAKS